MGDSSEQKHHAPLSLNPRPPREPSGRGFKDAHRSPEAVEGRTVVGKQLGLEESGLPRINAPVQEPLSWGMRDGEKYAKETMSKTLALHNTSQSRFWWCHC